jgi:hypothetical protein
MQTELNQFYDVLGEGPTASEVVDDTTVFKARMKMSPSAFFALDHLICQHFYGNAPAACWEGMRLIAVDGSTLRLPRWAGIVDYFDPDSSSEENGGCALARTLEFYDVVNGLTVGSAIEPYRESELAMLETHGTFLGLGDLLVADRGFAAFWVFAWLLARNCHFCIRLPVSTWNCARELVNSGAREQIVELSASTPEAIEQCRRLGLPPGPICVRLVRVDLPGGDVEVLCTSLLDSDSFGARIFGDLYHMRWPVEEKIKRNKCRAEIENFSGKSAHSVMQDFYSRILVLNLARILAWTAEPEIEKRTAGHQCRYQVNWASALKAVKRVFPKLFHQSGLPHVLGRLKDWFVNNVTPIRPGRSYPRNHKAYRRVFYITYKSCI